MRLDEPDHDVGPALEPAPALVEHGARLADPGGRTEVDAEIAQWAGPPRLSPVAALLMSPRLALPRHGLGTLGCRPVADRPKAVTDVKRGRLATNGTYQHTALGIVVTLPGLGALLALLLPFRAHLSIALPALLFVLPALIGVVIDGFVPGAVGALRASSSSTTSSCPPTTPLPSARHRTGSPSVSMSRSCSSSPRSSPSMRSAREEALRRTGESERLYELSQALIGDLTLSQLLTHIVSTVQGVFAPRWTALVLPDGGRAPPGRARCCGSPPRRASPDGRGRLLPDLGRRSGPLARARWATRAPAGSRSPWS